MSKILYATFFCACLVQTGARREAIKQHDPSQEEDDMCSPAVPGSMIREKSKKQTEKCKCPVGYFLLGENAACQTRSRYFNPDDVKGFGCACATCSEIVTNSNIRDTAKKQELEKCKCPKAHVVSGNDDECFSLEPGRYFDPIKLMGKGCQCWNSEQVQARTTLLTTPISTTASGFSGDESDDSGDEGEDDNGDDSGDDSEDDNEDSK